MRDSLSTVTNGVAMVTLLLNSTWPKCSDFRFLAQIVLIRYGIFSSNSKSAP